MQIFSKIKLAPTGRIDLASARRAGSPILATITLAFCVSLAATTNIHVVLPNPKLMGCESATCSQLWLNDDGVPAAKYPEKLSIDFSDGSPSNNGSLFGLRNGMPYGLMAVYDKSVTTEDVAASINEQYGRWAYGDTTGPLRLWKVEPEKFVIQLSSHKSGPLLIYVPIAAKPVTRQRSQ